MIRHVVLFRFQPEATAEQREALTAQLRALPAQIPELRAYHVGPDAGLNPGNFEFAVTADFDDVSDYRVYADHPVHQAVIADYVRPILAERVAVQYEC
jgi:hypothetical protein